MNSDFQHRSPPLDLQPSLNVIQAAQLLRRADEPADEPSYIFKHVLVQQTAYESLLKQDRQQLHRAVGEALERMFPAQRDTLALQLAQHFAAAGDNARAFEYYTRAGDSSSRIYAHAEAVMHYTHALALASDQDAARIEHLYTAGGRALELSGNYQAALDNYTAMGAWGQAHAVPSIELYALLARTILHATFTAVYDPPRGKLLAEQALALARELGDRASEAKALWTLQLLAAYGSFDPEQAIRYGEEALALARRQNLREQTAYILNDLFYPYLQNRTTTQALAIISEAKTLWEAEDNKSMVADALATSAAGYFLRGEFERALQNSHQALEIGRSIGNLWAQSHALSNTGYLYFERGDPQRAIQDMEQSIRWSEEGGFVTPQVITRGDLGWVYSQLGAHERGLALAKQALAMAETKLPFFGEWVTIALGRILVASERLEEARLTIYESRFNLRAPTPLFLHPQPVATRNLLLADYALATGRCQDAISTMDDLLRYLRARETRAFIAEALYLQACAAVALGEIARADMLLESAQASAQALGSTRMLWQILTKRGQLDLHSGERNRAALWFGEAESVFQKILQRTRQDLRQSLAETPAARALREGLAQVGHGEPMA